MGNFEIVAQGSKRHSESLEFRTKMLCKPINISLNPKTDNSEIDTYISYIENDVIVGILIITEIDSENVQIRQVAIDDSMQGLGLGKKIIKYAEELILKRKYSLININARSHVLDFYLNLDYKVVGEEFISTNSHIPHFKVIKKL